MVTWLSSLPAGVLVIGWLALGLLVAAVARLAVRALVPAGDHDQVLGIAAPLMPALGAAFAIFTALTLSSEAGYLRTAEHLVSDEAAAASRLAWAATSPGVQSEPIHSALRGYLQTTRAVEWRGASATSGDDPATAAALSRLEQTVRAEAARSELGTPASTELLASVDAVTSSRRARLAAASHEIPALYILTLIASGLALIANAGALAFRSSVRTSLLVGGLASVVGLSLALLFALTAPWRGPLLLSGHPVDAVVRDLQAGWFDG
jgi:hypothetical protein